MIKLYSTTLRYLLYSSLLGLSLLSVTTSCVSPKTIVYFQGDTLRYSSSPVKQIYIPTIQKNDMLSIIVGSLNAEANEIFNASNQYTTVATNYGGTGGSSSQSFGYLVDATGSIELPLIGKVKLEGLQNSQAADTLRTKLQTYLKEPSVTIRNINFKVSVLGAVNRTGVYTILDEKITLPEVISLAGDLTIFGKRENIMIIREESGKREFARVNLTTREVFDSPYYNIHKNDIIYVEPSKAGLNQTDRVRQLIPLYISIVSAISILIIRFF